jgi:hypothetical protein
MAQRMPGSKNPGKNGFMNPAPTTQTARQFMESYLREKAELMKWDRQMRGAFEAKLYTAEIMERIYSLREATADLNRETLSTVVVYPDGARAVTTKPATEHKIMIRYHLKMAGQQWKICSTETLCMHCHGSARTANGSACPRCDGTGWKDYARESFEQSAARKAMRLRLAKARRSPKTPEG